MELSLWIHHSVHHLLFVDDSLLLCKATFKEFGEIMSCIRCMVRRLVKLLTTKSLRWSLFYWSLILQKLKSNQLFIYKEGGKGSYMSLLKCYRVQKESSLFSLKRQFNASLLNCYFREVKKIYWSQVSLSLPLFEMSCFKLPKDVYTKLISAMIELWWSSGNIRRKFIWVAWQSYVTIRER